MKTWDHYNQTYDALMAVGDYGKAQQSRLAIALYNMVLTSGEECLALDMRVYRRNAVKGQSYLDRNNLPAFPDASEIAAIAYWMNGN